jgi:hypothetical protein
MDNVFRYNQIIGSRDRIIGYPKRRILKVRSCYNVSNYDERFI